MQELEKILEEIELEKKRCSLSRDCSNEYAVKEISLLEKIEKIIRKHVNDGWISVDDRLPMRTLDEKINESYQKYLVFIDGVDGWDIDIAVYDFWNDKKWREAHDGYGEIENVIAWRPLPEPYKPKQPETCKYTGGSCCWPIDQCSDCPNNPERSDSHDGE